jgi:hypothetical protein
MKKGKLKKKIRVFVGFVGHTYLKSQGGYSGRIQLVRCRNLQ